MFKNYESRLKATQLKNKINYNEKVKLTQIVLKNREENLQENY